MNNLQLMGLCAKLFTTAAVDNIDYNPSSTTAKTSFHGTGISLIQHPSHEFIGYNCDLLAINTMPSSPSLSQSTSTLPMKYTNLPPASINSVRCTTFHMLEALKMGELNWLEIVMTTLKKEQLDKTDWISRSAYHANIQEKMIPSAAINARYCHCS